MTDADPPTEPGRYDEPQERLTRIAGAATEAILNHPEFGEDIKGAFMLHDEAGGSGSCLLGYPRGEEAGFESLRDVIEHIRVLFKSSGVEMELSTVTREDPGDLLSGEDGGPEEQQGKGQKVVLTISADATDVGLKTVCEAVRTAVEATSGLGDTKMIIIMGLGEQKTVLMHHGYEHHHAMVHALFGAFQESIALEGGQVAIVPVMSPGTWN